MIKSKITKMAVIAGVLSMMAGLSGCYVTPAPVYATPPQPVVYAPSPPPGGTAQAQQPPVVYAAPAPYYQPAYYAAPVVYPEPFAIGIGFGGCCRHR